MKKSIAIAYRFLIGFTLLVAILTPFPYSIIPEIGVYLKPVLEPIIKWFGDNILSVQQPYTHQLVSDSTGMYILILLIGIAAVFIAIAWSLLSRKNKYIPKVLFWFQTSMSYYLALMLFKYGFSKVFKHQFYLPEPNTLYTPLGQITPDLLYWSAIGSSYSYTVVLGVLEIIPAILLLFKRTRLIGIILSVFILANIAFINFGFDISVKIYSLFLLFVSVVLLLPYLKSLFAYFIKNQATENNTWQPNFNTKNKAFVYAAAKSVVIGVILFECLFMYFSTNSFNGNNSPKPLLYGAYDVQLHITNQDTVQPLLTSNTYVKRLFIHKEDYLILQFANDEMQDYKLFTDPLAKQLTLSESEQRIGLLSYQFDKENQILTVDGILQNDTINIKAKQIELKKLPLLKSNFNWTIDGYRY